MVITWEAFGVLIVSMGFVGTGLALYISMSQKNSNNDLKASLLSELDARFAQVKDLDLTNERIRSLEDDIERMQKDLDGRATLKDHVTLREYSERTRHTIANDLSNKLAENHKETREKIAEMRTEIAVLKSGHTHNSRRD